MKIVKIYTGYVGDYGQWNGERVIGYASAEKVEEVIANFRKEHEVHQFWMSYPTDTKEDGTREIRIKTEEIKVVM